MQSRPTVSALRVASVLSRAALVGLGCVLLLWPLAGAAQDGDALRQFWAEAKDSIPLNTEGKKKKPVAFDHRAHAGGETPDGYVKECGTCHHTADGTAAPLGCTSSGCHVVKETKVDGEFLERKTKTKWAHAKAGSGAAGGASCTGCHKQEKKAGASDVPTSCKACHAGL